MYLGIITHSLRKAILVLLQTQMSFNKPKIFIYLVVVQVTDVTITS